jgi:type III secretion system FlhB-like substrate exporter
MDGVHYGVALHLEDDPVVRSVMELVMAGGSFRMVPEMATPSLPRVVGLSYNDSAQQLPTVVLKAAGPVTDALLSATLHASGPRVVRDAALLKHLYRLPVDAAIDLALFQLVAVLLSHVLAGKEQIRGTAGHAGSARDRAMD